MPGAICSSPGFGNNCQNTPWFVLMLPFIEQGPLYNSFNASIGMEGPESGRLPGGFIINSTVFTTKIASFQCPSDSQTYVQMTPDAIRLALAGHQGKLWRQLGKPGLTARALPRWEVHGRCLELWLQSPFGFSRAGTGPFNCRDRLGH